MVKSSKSPFCLNAPGLLHLQGLLKDRQQAVHIGKERLRNDAQRRVHHPPLWGERRRAHDAVRLCSHRGLGEQRQGCHCGWGADRPWMPDHQRFTLGWEFRFVVVWVTEHCNLDLARAGDTSHSSSKELKNKVHAASFSLQSSYFYVTNSTSGPCLWNDSYEIFFICWILKLYEDDLKKTNKHANQIFSPQTFLGQKIYSHPCFYQIQLIPKLF